MHAYLFCTRAYVKLYNKENIQCHLCMEISFPFFAFSLFTSLLKDHILWRDIFPKW